MSVEAPRRAVTDQALARLSRGSTRLSDRFAGDSDLELDLSPFLHRDRESLFPAQPEGPDDNADHR